MWNLKRKGKKTVMITLENEYSFHDISASDLLENGLEDTGRGKGKLGRSERVAWTYIYYQIQNRKLVGSSA